MVYAMNKFYAGEKGPSLWRSKSVALLSSCGYRPERGSDLLEEGLQRYCRHSQLRWLGNLVERHLNYDTPFMNEEKVQHVRTFAAELLQNL